MATHISNLDLGLLVGVFGGVGSFFRGFRVYREYLRVQGTPAIPIRSIAVGLVRIHGNAAGESLVASPISHTPCCFYQVRIQKWRDDGEKGTWLHYGADSDGERFYLEDSSGRVLVAPRGAERDIESTAVREKSGFKGCRRCLHRRLCRRFRSRIAELCGPRRAQRRGTGIIRAQSRIRAGISCDVQIHQATNHTG
jgi:hypothetical protein